MAAGNSLLVTQGTQNNVAADQVGGASGTYYPYVRIDVGTLTALASGTVTAGTVNTGTINTGTVDSISQLPPNFFGTVINTGTNLFGTIKAAVTGSVIYVTDLTINMGVVGGTVAIYNGSTGAPLAGTFIFNQNGGLVQNYRVPLQTTSGSALTYQQQGTASLSINVQGFVR